MNHLKALWRRIGQIRVTRTWAIVAGLGLVMLLVWIVGPLISVAHVAPLEGRLARLVVILALALGALAYVLLQQRDRRRRNEAMVKELAASPPPQVEEDYSDEDVKAMHERTQEALAFMRSAHVGKNKEFVYELPWYLIIGPPGAGKTTALRNSGLKFPVASKFGDAPMTNIGGTRNCDWWFTDQAVLIDTAGRYTTQDSHQLSDSKSWLGFLDLLAKHRPLQPVTGLLVAISATDLINGDDREIAAHGRAIRARINEVMEKLGVKPPVYLIITKLDLVSGFSEFFEDIPQSQRDQVLGHTFDLEASRAGATATELFSVAFDGLCDRICDRLPGRIQAERDIQRRGAIFGFPQQIASLKPALQTLIQFIGRETKFEPTPLVRGFYFSSATQFGRPIDRLMAAVAANFGLSRVEAVAAGSSGRSYFIRDLLHSVVFGEGALAESDPRAHRRRIWIRRGVVAGGALVLALALIVWTVSYVNALGLIHQLQARSDHLSHTVQSLGGGDVSDSDLTEVLPMLDQARSLPFASTAPASLQPFGFTLGMSRTHALRVQADGAYQNALNRWMLPRLILDLEDQIRAALQHGGDEDRRQQIYGLLRVYLMLGRSAGAPLNKDQIESWFSNEWQGRFARAEDDPTRAALQKHLEALLSGPVTAPPLDRDLIAAARVQIRSLGAGERAYSRMLSDPALAQLPPFSLTDVPSVGNSGLFLRKSGKSISLGVPGMYRRQAFFSTVAPTIAKIASQSLDEAWVETDKPGPTQNLATSAAEAGRIKDEILIAYLKDFTHQWDSFIDDIAISPQHNAAERIQIATQPPSPVKLLINALGSETNLLPPEMSTRSAGGAAGAARVAGLFSRSIYRGVQNIGMIGSVYNNGAAPAGPPGPLDDVIAHFQWLQNMNPAQGPSPLETALQALAATGDATLSAKAASGLADPNLQRTKTSAAMEATAKLDQVTTVLPPKVRDLFTGFVKASATELNQRMKSNLQQTYAAGLGGQCASILKQGFPFTDDMHDVSLDDLSRLLRPQGLLDQFVQANLSGMIDTSGRSWAPTPAGQSIGLQPTTVRALQDADKLSRKLFQPGDIRPNVRFWVEPVEIETATGAATLSIDGVPVAFSASDRKPVEMRWPGSAPGVSISFPNRGGAPILRAWNGDFGIMEMLRNAKIISSTSRALTFELTVQNDRARFALRFINTENPFQINDYRAIKCPATL